MKEGPYLTDTHVPTLKSPIPDLKRMARDLFREIAEKTTFTIPPSNISDFVNSVHSHYYQNPYHSFSHGVDVMLTYHNLLTVYPRKVSSENHFFLCIIALNHDVLHPGHSNSCLIKSNPMLPIIHSTTSINEMVSIKTCKRLIEETGLLKNLEESKINYFYKLLESLILATDIESEEFAGIVKKVIASPGKVNKEIKFNVKLGVLLRIADLSNCLFNFENCVNWTYRLYLEMNKLKLRENEIKGNLGKAFLYETKFLKGVVIPLLKNGIDIGVMKKSVHEELKENVISNVKKFKGDFNEKKESEEEIIEKYRKIIFWEAYV